MKIHLKITFIIVVIAMLLAGCNAAITVNKEENNDNSNSNNVEDIEKNDKNDESIENIEEQAVEQIEVEKEEPKKEIDLQEVKPNESGQVMVVMYHALSDKEATYIRTVDNFKEDLRLLYERGYRLVSLNDYINNEIEIEAGKTPVVLTFDDGNLSDFNIIEENGEKEIDPNSAVGILKEFQENHPDFGLEATFFLNGGNPFRQQELVQYKLDYILEQGMDIGNHSYSHENLGDLSGENIQKTLGKTVKYINEFIPEYTVNALALPFGARPKDEALRELLYNGTYENTNYNNIGVLAVGWKPEYPSIHKDFDFRYIHRVHGSSEEFGIRYWMDYFESHPNKKYISDGDSDIVTIPEENADNIIIDSLNDKTLRTYKIDKIEQ